MTAEERNALGEAQYKFKRRYKIKTFSEKIISFAISAGVILAGVVFILTYGIKIYRIEGDGMEPEIKHRSIAVGNRLAYRYREPSRGDVISAQGRVYRIIGLPGDEVILYGGHVYINGMQADETDYLAEGTMTYPVLDSNYVEEIPAGYYFVLCDSRDSYDDSRSEGLVFIEDIESRIMFGIYQLNGQNRAG